METENNKVLEKMKAFMDSDEGKEFNKNYFQKQEDQYKMLQSQLDRFNIKLGYYDEERKLNFEYILNKLIEKYDSNKYYYRWMNRGIEPPCDLYWFLFEYAKKYGKKPTRKERKYINMFTSECYIVYGYFIQRMDGQGSVIRIDKL